MCFKLSKFLFVAIAEIYIVYIFMFIDTFHDLICFRIYYVCERVNTMMKTACGYDACLGWCL